MTDTLTHPRHSAPPTQTGAGAPPATATPEPARVELPIVGLTRSAGPALEQALRAAPGVVTATVNAQHGRAYVAYDPQRTNVGQLVDVVRRSGLDAGGASLRLKVQGQYCAECGGRIEAALEATPGVLAATFNAATDEVKVDYLPGAVRLDALNCAVEAAGPYRATPAHATNEPAQAEETGEQEREYRQLMRKWWFAAAVGVPTLALSYPSLIPWLRDALPRGSDALRLVWVAMAVASLAVMAYSGSQFFAGMWQGLRRRAATMHTLISGSLKGVLAAIQISQATMRNVYQNLFGAFVYNALGIPVALGVLYPFFGLLLSPLLAALAMSFSSVTVISNANRLRRWKLKEGAR